MKIFTGKRIRDFSVVELAWDSYARFYDVAQPFFIRLFRLFGDISYDEFEEKFVELARVEQGATVLDVACGTGAGHQALSRVLGPDGKVVAVDISAEMLQRARARARRLKLRNIRYRKADAEKLSDRFEKESFDAVLSCNGLPNFVHPQRALAEMARALRPGGTLALSTVNRDKCETSPLWRWAMKFPPGRFPYSEEYRQLLKEAGFVRITFHEQGMMLIIRAKKRAGRKPRKKRAQKDQGGRQ